MREIELRGRAEDWSTRLEDAGGDRWRCRPKGEIVVVLPNDADWSPGEVVVVIDERSDPPRETILAAYHRGATAYVTRANPELVIRHLDAVARRLPFGPGGDQ